jgi:hypothetical protein
MTAIQTDADHNELAGTLQLEVCADRLLGYLFPFGPTIQERPGRHRLLKEAIEGTPGLLRALLDADRKRALRAWSLCLRERGKDLRFQHVLAVLYRERALAAEDSPAGVLVFATVLWALLLSTGKFWAQLERPAVDDRNRLVEKVLKELLSLQVVRGNRELAAGRRESALPYLRCLKDILAGSLSETLATYDLHYRHIVDDQLMAQVRDIAEDVLNNWCADTVKAAKQSVDDPEAISQLPEGVRRNYEEGIRRLEPFAQAGVPAPALLRTGLEWYNDWRDDLFGRHELDQIGELSTRAGMLADRLARDCRKGRAHEPENGALSVHFLFRGLAAESSGNTDSAIRDFELSAAWDPSNNTAEIRLFKASMQLATEADDSARQEELLRTALDEPWSTAIRESLTSRLAKTLFDRACSLVTEAHDAEAHFGSAANEIVSAVQAQLSTVARNTTGYGTSAPAGDCAVCGGPSSSARKAVISAILVQVRTEGSFKVKAVQFWSGFGKHLCFRCAERLASIHQLFRDALNLSERALELDPGNPFITKSIETIRKLMQ